MTVHPFGTGWRFGPEPAGSDLPDFDDSGFAEVTLPHTVVPLSWRERAGRAAGLEVQRAAGPAPEPGVSVDFWQPGGIHRDVRLRVAPSAFLADVFAKPVSVLDPAVGDNSFDFAAAGGAGAVWIRSLTSAMI